MIGENRAHHEKRVRARRPRKQDPGECHTHASIREDNCVIYYYYYYYYYYNTTITTTM